MYLLSIRTYVYDNTVPTLQLLINVKCIQNIQTYCDNERVDTRYETCSCAIYLLILLVFSTLSLNHYDDLNKL